MVWKIRRARRNSLSTHRKCRKGHQGRRLGWGRRAGEAPKGLEEQQGKILGPEQPGGPGQLLEGLFVCLFGIFLFCLVLGIESGVFALSYIQNWNLPASASQKATITTVHHHARFAKAFQAQAWCDRARSRPCTDSFHRRATGQSHGCWET